MKTRNIRQKIVTFFLFLSIASGFATTAEAQNIRQVLYPQGPVRQRPKYCNGGWSGVVTYTKTLNDSLHSDEPLLGHIDKAKNRQKHDMTRNYKYEGRAVVDGADPLNPVVNTHVTFTDDHKSSGQQKEYDSCHAFNDEHFFFVDGIDNQLTTATAEGPAKTFNLVVIETAGIYSFDLKFPESKGKYTREEHVRRKGFCQPKNNEPYDRSTNEPHVEPAQGFSVDNQKIDPEQPDLLAGTRTWGDDGKGAIRTFAYTVTWRFTRCPGKLLVTDIKFEHPKFPDWDNWKEFDPYYDGTTDGNRVRITAKVLNMSGETRYVDVKIAEDKEPIGPGYQKPPDIPIPDGDVSVRIEPGEEREVQIIWDTEGQAWNDYGQPNGRHAIKAEAFENGKKESSKMEDLIISPKPLVLVHGLWSSPDVWDPVYPNYMNDHQGHWKAYMVGQKPAHGKLNTGGKFMSPDKTMSVFQNADELAKYVKYAQEDSNAWHVDMVGHDLGGLIARVYIHKLMQDLPDRRPLVKHLMMLGTPNNGAACADTIGLKFTLYGENVQAINDMQPDRVATFNQYVTNRKGVKFSALAGNSVPVTCGGYTWNDGFVTVESAIYGVEDYAYSNDLHHQLTNGENMGKFVLPHVITGPKGTYPLPVRSDPNDWRRWQNKREWNGNEGWGGYKPSEFIQTLSGSGDDHIAAFQGDSIQRHRGGPSNVEETETAGVAPRDDPARFSHEVKLAPGQSVEVDVPVQAGPNFGLTLLADPAVSATLTDNTGTVRDTNLKGSPESGLLFRPLFTGRAVQTGTWKLKLENTSANEAIVLVAGWASTDPASFSLKAEKPNAAGGVPLKAALRSNGAPVAGARVTAAISGVKDPIELLDDGQHGDGPAGDGVYGATTEKLGDGEYTIKAKAEFENRTKTAYAAFAIGKTAEKMTPKQPPPGQKAKAPVKKPAPPVKKR